jgi:GDP-4-dehydro-6-deoxy-D-mannose reductase
VFVTDRLNGGPDLLDAGAFTDLVGEVRPEVVYHLAGDADVGGSWDHPRDTFRANAEGTLNLLDACRSHAVRRVLAISSADVYGVVAESELPLREDAELRPTSPYAASKVAAEFLGIQAFRGWGLEVIPVRAFNHIGPGQSERFFAPGVAMRIVRAERTGDTTIEVGNLTPRRDLTDVRDVVRAYRRLAEDGTPGRVYNVCSGVSHAIGEVVELLLAASTAPLELVADPALQRPVDIPVLRGDHQRLTADTGWQPLISLEQSLSDLLTDCRARP